MEESNTVDARLPWASLCNVNELAFRTACNAAVAASSRPIKRRVIHRLAESAEAQRVFSFVWMSAEKKEPPIEPHFFEELTKSQLWSTLVVEAIAEERKWGDIFSPAEFSGNLDRLHAFWEKCFGKDASALTKVASTAAAGAGSLAIATQFNPNVLHTITLPIEVELKGDSTPLPVRFVVDSKGDSIPITFKGPDGATTIPVRFEASVNDKPLKLHFESDTKDDRTPAAALNLVASRLDQTNTSITTTAAQLTNLVKLTSNGNSEALLDRLGEVSSQVHQLTDAFNRAVATQMAISQKQGDAVTANLNLFAKTTIVPYRYRLTQLRPNSIQTVVIPTIEPTDGTAGSAKITLCTGKMDSEHRVQLKIFDAFNDKPCGRIPANQWTPTPAGSDVRTDDRLWIATVNSVDHHWYGNPSATVTLSPTQKPELAATVAQQGSGN
jgi:hypothetical protein